MLTSSILQTLAYADIFDYPLTGHEVWDYLIGGTKVESKVVQEQLGILADLKRICADGEFYFLKGRNESVEMRKKREGWSKNKWEIAQRTAGKLRIIPTVKMVGITGALAMNNCEEKDDIDLLIVASENCLWLTRLLILLISPILGIRRRKSKDIVVKDKICFNLFLEENHLKIEPENLFLAHEIVQVKPILDKDQTYRKFMEENSWVKEYLPNAKKSYDVQCTMYNSQKRNLISQYLNLLISFLNTLAFKLQYLYMKPKMTIEKVSLHQAFFHPKDISEKIEKEYKSKLLSLGLDKNEIQL